MRSGAARVTIEYTLDHAGECRYYEARLVRQDSEQILVVVRNITSRRRAELDLQIKEEHLRHALKMEAIGLLAGGIAHDFNNLVTAIGGYSELVLEQLAPNDPVREDVVEIQRAGTSAAALTRQLLAFASRQILSPRVIDLNEAVCRTESLLGRLIRENITLETQLAPGGDSIRADPGEIEQIIINLVVNARDAMPEGGSIVVGTSGVEIVEPTETSLGSLKPGRYTMLYVSDTGSGIAEADLPHIFEPFFTTKEVGSGTGLGLATVYGIVKQSGGVLSVRSQLSVGTTFEILFPVCQEAVAEAEAPIRAGHIRGTETVLLVEDQHGVRSVTKAILQRSGYQVIEASDGISAQKLGEDHPGVIDLLLSDMVLPSLNGRVLAERLTESRPSMRVLLTSGYTDDRIALKGIEERRYSFVPKPYGSQQLLAKVREVLGTPSAEMSSAPL
jgi:signal transduction histidine kinase/ActR/RegA family two-component response regulator